MALNLLTNETTAFDDCLLNAYGFPLIFRNDEEVAGFIELLKSGTNLFKNKLGYKNHGYSKFTFITNKVLPNFWSQMITLLNKLHGYNDGTVITNKY